MMIDYIQSVCRPAPMLALGVAIAVELLGGIALVLGYRTRLGGQRVELI
jgi:putative oxidoreductase